MFWFQPYFFLEMFRWTPRMHSWFVQLFFWKICGHVDYGFDKLGGDLFQGFGIFSIKVRKNIQNNQNNQFTPHVALVTWNAVFATVQNLFRLKTRNTLARSPDVRKILFLPVLLSIEMFDWTLRTSIWRTRSFLETQNFLEKKPWKDLKLNLLQKKFKKFLWSRRFRYGTLVETFCQKSGNDSQTYFLGEKTRLSQSFSLDIWNAMLTTPLKMFCQETGNFSLSAQNSKSFGLCQNYCLEVLRSAGHVENLPGSSSFSFEPFADAKVADLTPLADQFCKNLEIFR